MERIAKKSTFGALAARTSMLAAAAAVLTMTGTAHAEGITGSRKVDAQIEQSTTVKGAQTAVAVGQHVFAANVNSSVFAEEVGGRIKQTTVIEGAQTAVAVGQHAFAANVNSSVAGSMSTSAN